MIKVLPNFISHEVSSFRGLRLLAVASVSAAKRTLVLAPNEGFVHIRKLK